jgi:hypothetical protein
MMRSAAMLLALTFVASGCGPQDGTGSKSDGGLTVEETRAVAKIERGYPGSDWGNPDDPKKTVHCMALAMVTEFGVPRLQKYGVVDANLDFDKVSSEPMSAPDAALFTDVTWECGGGFKSDLQELIRSDTRHNMSRSEMAKCVRAVSEQDVREASEGYLREDAEPMEKLFNKLRRARCGDFTAVRSSR